MGQQMNGSWDAYLASLRDFAGVDNIITNLAKEREPGVEIMERTPLSLIVASLLTLHYFVIRLDILVGGSCILSLLLIITFNLLVSAR